MFDLSGKIGVITGAGKGLGKEFASSMSGAGAEMFLVARDIERLQNTADEISELTGNKVHALQGDITDEQSVAGFVSEIHKRAKKIDILINNAAAGRSPNSLIDENLETWNNIIGVNLTGTFLVMKHVGKIMIEQRSGKIINLSSLAAVVASKTPAVGAYDVSKAGIQCLTRVMAGAWAKYGITVNSICPGFYMTEINKEYLDANPGFYEESLKDIPLNTWGEPKNIGDIGVFLSSPASDYMTGANLVCDGGYSVM